MTWNGSAAVQLELWLFPVIQPSTQKDVAAGLALLIQAQELFRHTAKFAQGTALKGGGQP
jgi:hypothetical protein